MTSKPNPLKLNALQAKTLAILQELAQNGPDAPNHPGGKGTGMIPSPHGNHFHVGRKVVMTRDATGLSNEAVWAALERKKLIAGFFPTFAVVTAEGLAYDTGVAHEILHGSDH